MGRIIDIDRGMNNLRKQLQKLQKTKIKVGVFSDATNSKGKNTQYVADYAIANEYGRGNIPERSFVRSTIDEKQEKWCKLMQTTIDHITKINNNKLDSDLYKIGEIARSDIICKIDSNINPPNAPATIKRKGSKNKTLIDNGILRASIAAKIEQK